MKSVMALTALPLFLALFIDRHTHTDGLDWTATYSIHTTI
jgi:hypothetical protein